MSDVPKVQRCAGGYLIYTTLDVPGREWGDTESIVPWMVLEERGGVIVPCKIGH